MSFALSTWLYLTFRAIFGLMILDFLIAFIITFWKGSFNLTLILSYLEDILFYVVPLYVILFLESIDPTGWILYTFFFILGLAVVIKYIVEIIKKFKP